MTTLLAAVLISQLLPGNSAGVSMGHLHLNVSDMAATRSFWVELVGAEPVKVATLEGVKLPGTLVFFKSAKPSAGTVGSVVGHVGVKVKKLAPYLAKARAAGYTIQPQENPKQAMIDGPDGMRVEFLEDETLAVPVAMHHIHWFTTVPLEVQAWYAANFGAVPGKRAIYDAADLPGVNLTFGKTEEKLAPTKGRALDHIGFEVKGLAEFCKRLEAKGVKFDIPYRQVPALGIAVAFFTDPFGTYVELTEGLDKF